MRVCVIFNPVAKGNKARRFRRHLDEFASRATLKLTTGPGDARRLAAEAATEQFEIVAAAGGDGTVNEVLNGLGDVPGGLDRTRLAVLPLGTVNVFARELALPTDLEQAWKTVLKGRETRIDLPCVEYEAGGSRHRRYFAQLAGAGLDARAVELVSWQLKKKFGPLAYVVAGLQALRETPARITASLTATRPVGVEATTRGPALQAEAKDYSKSGAAQTAGPGALVLIGNGRLYGGDFRIFPQADLRDGLLDVCMFPKVTWLTLARCGGPLLLRGGLPTWASRGFRAEKVSLTGVGPTPLEADGELIGRLPAEFSVERERLRVIARDLSA